jgi:hypothetical protein
LGANFPILVTKKLEFFFFELENFPNFCDLPKKKKKKNQKKNQKKLLLSGGQTEEMMQ